MSATHANPAAETPSEALARLYDLDLHDDPGDLDLWTALAAEAGGPVLELMAGSGRIAVPLAEEGHAVTAVDVDAAMLDRARRRAEAAGPEVAERVTLVLADVVGLELSPASGGASGGTTAGAADAATDEAVAGTREPAAGSFDLAFIALNSILLLASRAAQQAAWEALASRLAPGGIAAVDAWLPDAHDLARYDGRLHLEYHRPDPETGHWVTKTAAAQHDAASQTIALTTIYEEGDPGAPASRWVRCDVVRIATVDELRSMAASAGLEVELVAGGYDLEPLGPHDDRAVVIARMPGSGRSR